MDTQRQIEAQARIDAKKAKLAQQNAGVEVAKQNLISKGIDPTKLGTGTGENFVPNYTPPVSNTPGQNVSAQNLINNGIDPAKVGTGVGENFKPYVSPILQAKIDAKNTPVTPPVVAPVPVTPVPVATPPVEPVKPVEAKPVEIAPTPVTTIAPPVTATELTDIEKQAQATGVKYTMVDGVPQYTPTTRDEALKIQQMGGKFQGDSALAAVAKYNIEKQRKLSQMTDTQLAQNITNGNVSSRELEQINAVNPDLVAKAKDMARKSTITDTANTIQADNNAIVTGKETQVQNKALNNLLTKVAELDANAETYGDIKARVYANYPDMEVAKGEIVNAQTQLRQLQRAKRDLFKDYKEKNSSLPISMIMAGYSALSKGIDDQIYEVNDTLSQNVALYNSYLDEAKSEIDWEIGSQEKQEQRLFDLYGVTNAAEIRQQDIVRADKLLADEIARTDKKDQQTLDRLNQERTDNIKTALAQLGVTPVGQTYDELLGEYATAVKNQPKESKVISGIKPGEMIYQDGKFITAPGAVGAGNVTPNRPNIRYETTANNGGVTVNVEAGYAGPEDRRTKYAGGYQCGQFVNDVAGIGVGDTLTEKENMISKNLQATPGAAFVEDIGSVGSINGKPTGHIGIIEKVYDDGSFDVVEANYAEPGKVTRTTISPGDKRYNNIKGFVQTDLMKEPEAQPLSDKQYTQYNQAFSKFTQEPTVKSFEGALTSGGDLMASLNSANGPGDVGAVFQFMKTLDPSSTVREGEFALAAKSAGVWEQFKNIPANKLEGTILTEEQRRAFGKLALEYVKNKAKAYDVKYNDLTRILKNQGIPESYYPTKMSDFISQYAEQKTPDKPNIFKQGIIGGEANVDSSTIF